MIRKATADDMGRLLEMGERFVSETDYKEFIVASPERIAELVVNVLASPDGAVLVSETDGNVTGMIALIANDHPYSGERMAFELVWWVEPEARGSGVRLLRAAEEWARAHGAKAIQMVAPSVRVGEFYRRLGYQSVETSYQRSL